MHRRPDAIVLCGGAGTRLRTVTDGPKAMVLVGGRPFLELLLRQLRRSGIERVILAVGYQGDAIRNHFGDQALGLEIAYSPELTPLGTGGALRNAADLVSSSTILVLNGDSYTDADLHRFVSNHTQNGAEISVLVVPPDGREDCGTVSVDPAGRLLDFKEKQPRTGPRYVNAGIYLVSREILYETPSGIQLSMEKDLVPKWLAEGKHIRASLDPAVCHDIGTPERYQRAQAVLAGVEKNGILAPVVRRAMTGEIVRANVERSIEVHAKLMSECLDAIATGADALIAAYLSGHKALFFGNGGSAADAQHLAAEFQGRYLREREPMPAIALHTNSCAPTAIGNDYGYDQVFARQLRALAAPSDVAVAISTSGNSASVIEAVRCARSMGVQTLGLTGASGGQLHGLVDVLIAVPSEETPRIQECHILIGHALCDAVERAVIKQSSAVTSQRQS